MSIRSSQHAPLVAKQLLENTPASVGRLSETAVKALLSEVLCLSQGLSLAAEELLEQLSEPRRVVVQAAYMAMAKATVALAGIEDQTLRPDGEAGLSGEQLSQLAQQTGDTAFGVSTKFEGNLGRLAPYALSLARASLQALVA